MDLRELQITLYIIWLRFFILLCKLGCNCAVNEVDKVEPLHFRLSIVSLTFSGICLAQIGEFLFKITTSAEGSQELAVEWCREPCQQLQTSTRIKSARTWPECVVCEDALCFFNCSFNFYINLFRLSSFLP